MEVVAVQALADPRLAGSVISKALAVFLLAFAFYAPAAPQATSRLDYKLFKD